MKFQPMTHNRRAAIVAKMRVPVVEPGIVLYCGDPTYHGDFSTYNVGRDLMYLRPDIDPASVRHEYGHCFDAHVLRDPHRQLLLQWWGIPRRFWWWDATHDPFERGQEAGCEIFANVYARAAVCRIPGRYHRFKKLIRTAYKEAGYVD